MTLLKTPTCHNSNKKAQPRNLGATFFSEVAGQKSFSDRTLPTITATFATFSLGLNDARAHTRMRVHVRGRYAKRLRRLRVASEALE